MSQKFNYNDGQLVGNKDEHLIRLNDFSDEILYEIITHMDQRTKLSVSLINSRFHRLANRSIYRQIYLNDCSVVESQALHLANRWTILYLPELVSEIKSRKLADEKLKKLITTFRNASETSLKYVEWIRINWDLDRPLQRNILELICNGSPNLTRLENVIDPECYEIIANGKYSNKDSKLLSFDMAPPNSLPEFNVDKNYLPNFVKFLDSRLYNNIDNITTLTLFIDPVILFGLNNSLDNEMNFGLYPKLLRNGRKLYIKDLKLHWRMEFFPMNVFQLQQKSQTMDLPKLSDIFDVKTLETLTIISWEEEMVPRNQDLLKQVADFQYLKDLSLISLQQSFDILRKMFDNKNMQYLKRLKFDFLDGYGFDNASPLLLRVILDNCKKLEYLDIRSSEFLIQPIVSLKRTIQNDVASLDDVFNQNSFGDYKFCVTQQCYCSKCCDYFDTFLTRNLFPKELGFDKIDHSTVQEFLIRDIFRLMKHYGLFPYSKATDVYPSVRTQPVTITEFVKKMNIRIFLESAHPFIKKTKTRIMDAYTTVGPIIKQYVDLLSIDQVKFTEEHEHYMDMLHRQLSDIIFPDTEYKSMFITDVDVIKSAHTLLHHNKKPYEYILSKLPNLKFLVFNDLPVSIVEESIPSSENPFGITTRRRIQPAFFSSGYSCNLYQDTATSKLSRNNMVDQKIQQVIYENTIAKEEPGVQRSDFKKDFAPYLLYPDLVVLGFRKFGTVESIAKAHGYPHQFTRYLNTESRPYPWESQYPVNMSTLMAMTSLLEGDAEDDDNNNNNNDDFEN